MNENNKNELKILNSADQIQTTNININLQIVWDKLIAVSSTCKVFRTQIFYENKPGIYATKVALGQSFEEGEIDKLSKIQHDNIAKLKSWHLNEGKGKDYLKILIFEYIKGGSLRHCLKILKENNMQLTEEIIKKFMKDLVSAFFYCETNKIMLRDIEPDNIGVEFKNVNDLQNLNLLNATFKLLDFGNNSEYSSKADIILSLGITVFELVVGSRPFNKPNKDVTEEDIKNLYFDEINISNDLQCLIRQMLNIKPEERISIEELSEHEYLKGNDVKKPLENTFDQPKKVLTKCKEKERIVIDQQNSIIERDKNYFNSLDENAKTLQFLENTFDFMNKDIFKSEKMLNPIYPSDNIKFDI